MVAERRLKRREVLRSDLQCSYDLAYVQESVSYPLPLTNSSRRPRVQLEVADTGTVTPLRVLLVELYRLVLIAAGGAAISTLRSWTPTGSEGRSAGDERRS